MPFDVKIEQTGIDPDRSIRAFLDSYNETSQISHYQKNKGLIEEYFKTHINQNIDQVGIKNTNLKNDFSINFNGNNLEFISQNNQAMKYEFGSGQDSPKRFIEPAVMETANKISDIMISDAIELYQRKTRFG